MTVYFSRLQEKCEYWGGDLEIVGKRTLEQLYLDAMHRTGGLGSYKIFSEGPLRGVALAWKDKRILITSLDVNPGRIVHEMGHCFLDLDGPENSDELSWLGWEISLAKEIGCYQEWDAQNSDYGLYFDDVPIWSGDWGELTDDAKSLLIENRMAEARRLGILDSMGRARPRR